MGGAMAIFFFKCLIDNSLPQTLYFRPFLDFIFFFFLLVFIFLKILGGLPIEEPFASISQNMALIYFVYLTIIVYLVVLQENRFYLPLLNNKN
jgi:quinol-cytochrome oxidoreductase complex cytochrome b subunit